MFRKTSLAFAVALALVTSSEQARAGGYSVFVNPNIYFGDYFDGTSWQRSGLSNEVYTTFDSCWSSVVGRILRDWENDIDWEAYMIVWSDAQPEWGCLCAPTFHGAAQVVLFTYPVTYSGRNCVWVWYGGEWLGPACE